MAEVNVDYVPKNILVTGGAGEYGIGSYLLGIARSDR
jgi:hypothetical protein